MSQPRYLFACIFCFLSFTACSRHPKTAPEQQALSQSVHELLLPWHLHFAEQTERLDRSVERFCQNPNNRGEFVATREAWHQAMLAWQNVAIINFGPVTVHTQTRQIALQPDNHQMEQKIETLLAEETPLLANLADAHILVQGLWAMEYMLFDPHRGQLSTYDNPRACQYLTATSANLQRVAQNLYDAWQPQAGNFVATLLSADASNANFSTVSDSLAALLGAIINSMEEILSHKIGELFDGESGRDHRDAHQAEFWRSHLSLAAIKHQLSSIRQLFAMAISPVLSASDATVVAHEINHQLLQAEKQLRNLPGSLPDMLTAQEHLPQWQLVRQHLGEALSKLTTEVPNILQVNVHDDKASPEMGLIHPEMGLIHIALLHPSL